MLINPEFVENDFYKCAHIYGPGYVTGGWNSTFWLKSRKGLEQYPKMREYNNTHPKFEGYCTSYGVVDSIEQIQEIYKALIDDPNRKFYCQIVWVDKAEETSQDGWRWHKWGPYLGDLKPQHEYLYDEDDSIKGVLTFSFIEIKG